MADIRDKALLVIESLIEAECNPPEKVLDACFRYAHVARKPSCLSSHEDWVKELDRVYEAMVKAGCFKEIKDE